jgi:hypothetical protein
VSLNHVEQSKNESWPSGRADYVWAEIESTHQPKDAMTFVELTAELATPKGEVTRLIGDKDVVHLIYECPNYLCKEAKCLLSFQKKSGFANPFNHLKTCVADGKEEVLYVIYDENLKSKQKLGLGVYFGAYFEPSAKRITPYEHAVHVYLAMIAFNNLPVSIVGDTLYQNFSKYDFTISVKTIKGTIFKAVELVEQLIGKEMAAAGQGLILHDGWSCGSVHYIGFYACYIRTAIHSAKDGTNTKVEIVELVLLSCSPMANTTETEEESNDDEEAVNFTADTHCNHFKSMFLYYEIDIGDWALCQTADNCAVNSKIARLLNIPHIGCKNHLLNLEVNRMTDRSADLTDTIETVHNTMLQCKQRLKNAALLRNLVVLKPIIHNKTRWSGKFQMLARWLRLREPLMMSVSESGDSTLDMDDTVRFKNKVTKYTNQMKHINYCTKHLQTRKLTLGNCCEALQALTEQVEAERADAGADLYQCKLDDHYIGPNADILPDSDFECGVCKIQNGEVALMTDNEKEACLVLLLDAGEAVAQQPNEAAALTYAQRLGQRKRKRTNPAQEYRNCDFILGSAAEVERLWSIADNILTDDRKIHPRSCLKQSSS